MLIAEGFSPDVIVHGAVTLGDMMAADDNIKLSFVSFTIRKRSRPFAQGALRLASYARTAISTNRFVTKSFKRNGKTLPHLAEDMRIQALCKAFALEFNALVGPEYSIDFIVTTCLQGTSASATSSGEGEFISLEPYIGGAHVADAYVKYNGNNSYVNSAIPDDKVNIAAQAFSHFTFERSWGTLLVCDLQGVGRVLTDPAIHTLDRERFKLTDTNLNEDGFKFFFSTHVCNDVCRQLKLQSNRSMFISGSFEYRELWPTMDNTVCCSNKLCGRIVRAASAKRSDEFPGCHWCETCGPQLGATKVRWECTAPVPDHQFDVSRFFYESQGRCIPTRCPEHREKGETVTRAATMGEKFFSKFKSKNKAKYTPGKAW
ncbi:hypothetical protein ACO1O0_007031 [Amphichorda felina]